MIFRNAVSSYKPGIHILALVRIKGELFYKIILRANAALECQMDSVIYDRFTCIKYYYCDFLCLSNFNQRLVSIKTTRLTSISTTVLVHSKYRARTGVHSLSTCPAVRKGLQFNSQNHKMKVYKYSYYSFHHNVSFGYVKSFLFPFIYPKLKEQYLISPCTVFIFTEGRNKQANKLKYLLLMTYNLLIVHWSVQLK